MKPEEKKDLINAINHKRELGDRTYLVVPGFIRPFPVDEIVEKHGLFEVSSNGKTITIRPEMISGFFKQSPTEPMPFV